MGGIFFFPRRFFFYIYLRDKGAADVKFKKKKKKEHSVIFFINSPLFYVIRMCRNVLSEMFSGYAFPIYLAGCRSDFSMGFMVEEESSLVLMGDRISFFEFCFLFRPVSIC